MNSWPFPARTTAPAAAAPRPQPGSGTRLALNLMGWSYSVPTQSAKYPHPFRPTLSLDGVQLRKGLVEFREPTIGGVPIGGAPGKPQPTLRLEPGKVNEAGESWVCVEVHPDEKGDLPAASKIEIVQSTEPRSLDPTVGRCAIALVLWRDERPFRAIAIVHFNLRYVRVLPPAGVTGVVRHLFL